MRPSERAAEILIAVACIAAPLALGAVHPGTVFVLFVAMATAAALVIWDARASKGHLRLSPGSTALSVLAGWAALQLIPLPEGLLAMISPRVAEVSSTTRQLAGLAPGGHALSLQPDATGYAMLRFATLALAAFAVGNLRDRTKSWRVTVGAAGIGAFASLLVGLAHRMVGAQTFWGFYQAAIPPKLSTFVSSNHAASLFGLVAVLALVFAWRAVQTEQRRLAVALVAMGGAMFIAMMESDSAGTLGAFFVALVFAGSRALETFWRDLYPNRARLVRFGPWGVLAGCGALILASEALGRWFLESFSTRAELVRATLVGSADAWLTGFGAGATQTALPAYVNWPKVEEANLLTIESEPIEWLFTHGWPVAFLVVALFAVYLVPRPRDLEASERRDFFADATWVTGIYVAFVSMLHFPFWALGLSLPMVAVLESLSRQVHHRHHRHERRPHPVRYPFLDVSFSAAIASVLMLVIVGMVGFVAQRAETSLTDRPADATLINRAASEALRSGDEDRAIALAQHAVALEPTGRTLLFEAYLLASTRRGEEAVLAYRKAQGFNLGGRAVSEAARFLPPELAARAIVSPGQWKSAYAAIRKVRGPAPATDFALALAQAHTGSAEAAQLVVEAYWERKLYDVAEVWARLAILENRQDAQGNPVGPGLLVATLQRAGRSDEAREEAQRLFAMVPGDPTLQRAVLSLLPAAPEETEVRAAESAHKLFCHSARQGADRKLCDRSRAWFSEQKGDLRAAEEALRDIADRFDEPMPLGAFLARTRQCASLRTLAAARRTHRDAAALGALAAKCGAP